MSLDNLLESKIFKAVILSITGLIILSFVFGLGVYVGTKRAEFSFQWAEEYHKNFAGPRQGFFGDFANNQSQFTNSNGIFGKIIKINNNILTIKDNDGDKTEKTVLITDKTSLILQRKNIKISDLKIDDNVIVLGSPDGAGQITAELIRVMPAIKNPNIAPLPNQNQPSPQPN
jgi:hypothetical protein